MPLSYQIREALALRARRWAIIPLPHRSKNPGRNGWQHERWTADDLPHQFRGQCNIGVLLGEPSEWLVDVDLDHPLAVELAPQFLPTTPCIFGRAGKQRSHWLYVANGAETYQRRFKSSKSEMIVELRSTGAQTVFPGSEHECGERIEWAQDGQPAVVDAAELRRAVEHLAIEVERRLGIVPDTSKSKGNGQPHLHNGHSASDAVDRCRKYIAKMPEAVSGQGGHDATFAVACECFRFGLSDSDAAKLIAEYNDRCEPPWSDRALAHKLADAVSSLTNRS
jgi:Bifunctional DNA primase/polymerase, N-terminal